MQYPREKLYALLEYYLDKQRTAWIDDLSDYLDKLNPFYILFKR